MKYLLDPKIHVSTMRGRENFIDHVAKKLSHVQKINGIQYIEWQSNILTHQNMICIIKHQH